MQEQNDQESSKNLSLKDENTEENSELLSLTAQRERRNELYTQNSNAWTNKYEPSNLDSNLKKNSSFIKKMKTHLNAENCANLLKEVRTLKLEKYLSEVMVSLNEGLVKCKTTANVNAAVDVVSALHQRFPDSFTPELMDSVKQQLIPPSKATTNNTNDKEKEDTARISKQKVMLRLATEFWLVGLMENGSTSTSSNLKDEALSNISKSSQKISALCPIYDIIKDLLLYDQDTTLGLSLAISFVKQFGIDLLGVVPTNSAIKSENLEPQTNQSILITPEIQNSFKKLFESYFNRASKRIINEHKKIQKIEKSNEEQYINRGEITENSKTYFEKAFKAYEKDLSLINTFAELINLPQPILPEDDSIPAQSDSFVTGGDSSRLSAHKLTPTDLGPWDDEESKNFYTDILDIKLMVPGILLEGGAIPVQTASFIEDKQDDSEVENTDLESKPTNQGESVSDIAQSDINVKSSASVDSDPSANQASSPLPSSNNIKSAQLETLIAKLNNMANRDLVNEIAVEFCYMNTKSNRARLIQALFGVSRLRLDLIPYYCRLLATLNPYFPEITQGVLTSLANEFKSFRRRKATQGYEFRESRIKNIRYISELTKFGLAPPHDAFHCFKVLLEDMTNASNLETLCSMLDCCGRFLYKTPDSHERTSAMLEQMIKKKNAMILDPRLNTMIENAYYQVNPPDQPAFQVKIRSDVELFLIHLINEQLDFRSCDRISKILRRFNWEDPKIYNLLFKTFTKIWKVKDSSVALMAILLKGLQAHHSRFVIEVLDQIFEDVILGLEWNDYRYNQKRVYLMKFLGELYNYKMLDASTVFEALYTTITFGHENSFPILGNINPIDPPDDFFRIRLVNTILETCGNNLKLKKETSRLHHFIVFFQMYIFTKNELPLEIDFAVSDLFDKLNFGSLRLNSYEEAYQKVNEIIVQDQQLAQRLSSLSLKDNESTNMSDNENDSQYLEGISSHNSPHLNLSSDDEDLESVNDSASDVYSLSEHDDVSDHEDVDQQSEDDDLDDFDMINEEEMERKLREEEDEEFDREFNLMMAQSLDSRKYDRKTKLQDIQLPTRLGELKSAKIDPSQNRVAFTVLTKKIGKGQSSSSTISSKFLEVPSECSLAVNTLNRQEQERQEQIQLKKMVLDFEVQQDMQERKDFQQTLARHGVNLTNSSFASPDSSSNGQSTFGASSPGTKYRSSRNFKKI